jgi:signal transduction histidine kinase
VRQSRLRMNFKKRALKFALFSLVPNLRNLFFLVVFLFAVKVNAQSGSRPYLVTDITKSVYIFEDRNSILTFSDIVQSKNSKIFERNNDDRINFGISTSSIWIKFRMPDSADNFQISSPNLHEILVYAQDDKGDFQEINTGFLMPFGSRPINNDRFTFEGTPGQLYFVKIKSGHFINTTILAGYSQSFQTENLRRTLFYSVYAGAMLIIAAYVLFFVFQERREYLLLYFGYVLFITLINLTEKGFLLQYLWPSNPIINELFPIFPFGVSICLLLFIDELFRVKKKSPNFFQFVLIFIVAVPGILTLMLLVLNKYHIAIIIAQVHSIIICGIFIYLLFLAHKKRYKFKMHLLMLAVGILLFSLSVIVYLLAENGILKMNFFTGNSIVLGSFFEVIFSTSTIVLYQKSLRDRLQLLTINQNALLRQKVEERTKELVSKNDRLEDSILEKENLVSIIAHDLKSPLNQTKALSQLVQQEIGTCNDEAIKLAKHIEKVSNHGLQLIKELFEVTILETNREKIMFTHIDLKELSREVIENFVPISQKKQIELKFNCSSEVIINTYSPYVVRIFENILSNAIKFSPNGAKVEISVHDLHHVAMVSIKDMGPGFQEDDKRRMFKKFQKLSATPTAGESSNGLGLYIIKTLASRVNALITVESESGKGTIFSFSFPKA